MHQKFITKFNSISFTLLLATCALLPLIFLPASWSGLGAVKGVLLYGGVFLSFSFWLLAQFVEGTIKIPKTSTLVALGLWVLLALASALSSVSRSVSLWGRGFAVDSFATVLVLGLLAFLIAAFAREQRRLVKLFLATFAGSVATVLLQVILYVSQGFPFVSKYLSHVASQGTLVGSWVDFAYFVTFTFLLSLLMYEVLRPKGFFKLLSLFAMILSVAVLIFLNFKVAWIITIVSALLVFVYKSSVERSLSKIISLAPIADEEHEERGGEKESSRFPIMSFAALLVGLFFFLSSSSVGMTLSHYAGINFSDIRPSFSATTQVTRAALAHDPMLGAGAGRFSDVWNLYHPATVNQTAFWDTSFEGGFSIIESMFTTNGILAALALLAVLVLSLLHGFRLFNYQFPDRFSRFIAVTALIMLIAFVGLFVLASPGIVLIAFGFIYLGLLLGVSGLVGKTGLISFHYLRDPRLSFFAILLLVVATMAGLSSVFFTGNRFASVLYFNRALAATDAATSEQRLNRALSLSQNDLYWRTRAALFVTKFNALATQSNPDKAQLQNYFTQAEQSAQAAVSWDKGNATNWLTLSQVYQLIVASKAADSYTNAKQAADEAQKRNPNNPAFFLNQSRLALAKGDVPGARDYIKNALTLKPDYLDAFLLRGQIGVSQGDTEAIKDELSNYLAIAPFDEQGYTLLGQANINLKDYRAAADAFAHAINVNPGNPSNYLNHINTLILLGQKTQAIDELKVFKATFPKIDGVDEEIAQIQNSPDTAPVTPTISPKTKK